jgi:hypothetical protein
MKFYVIVESYEPDYYNRFVKVVFSEIDAVNFCNRAELSHSSRHYSCDYIEYETPN